MGKYVFRGRLISLRVEKAERGPREIVEHPGAAAVLALDTRGRILLVRQRREAAGKDLWEIPAGKLEPGEAPEEAARRELLEETGLSAKELVPLGAIYPTPGYSNEVIHLFWAREFKGEPEPSSEVAEVRFLPGRRSWPWPKPGRGTGRLWPPWPC